MSKAQYTKTLWQKEMKDQILSHVRAVFTNQVHPDSTFDVVSSVCDFRKGNARRRDGYIAHVIVYERPHEKEWKILASSKPKATGVEVYESLLEELQFHLSGLMDEFGE